MFYLDVVSVGADGIAGTSLPVISMKQSSRKQVLLSLPVVLLCGFIMIHQKQIFLKKRGEI